MMADIEQHERLEIYKLHAELADRVSQRREGANRLYVSLLVGLVVFLAALLRFGMGQVPVQPVLGGLGAFGVLLSISWIIVILSYRQLNSAKFRVLQEMEEQLVHKFFVREEGLFSEGGIFGRYRKLTVVETVLPIIFIILFCALIVYAFVQ